MLLEKISPGIDGVRPQGISRYDYLQRSNREDIQILRDRINDWASRFPLDEEFIGRFRNKDDRQHQGSLFELFTNEFLIRLGFNVERGKPLVGSKKTNTAVDFTVGRRNKPLFYLECTLANDSMTDLSVSKNKDRIESSLEDVNSIDFQVDIDFISVSHQTPSLSKIQKSLRLILENGYDRRSEIVEDKGWKIKLSLARRQKNRNKKQGKTVRSVGEVGAMASDPYPQLFKSLKKKKSSKYGQVDLPYIIAINSNEVLLRDSDILRVLFGQNDEYTFNFPQKEGYWYSSKPINRDVSSILLFSELYYYHLNPLRQELWRNPFSNNPLPEDLDLKLDDVRLKQSNGRFVPEKKRGLTIRSLMA